MRTTKLYGLEINLTDDRADLLEGGWEKERVSSMLDNISEGDFVIDVGAEEGDISSLMAIKGARMVLIEPSPTMWPHIKENWDLNKLPAPVCFEGFASDKTDKDIAIGGWPESALKKVINLRSFRHLNEESSITKQIKIDELGLQPKLITIDVEGSEFEVVKGATDTLKQFGPLLYISIHDDLMWERYKVWPHEMREYLFTLGYEGQALAWDHEMHWLFRKVR